MLLIFRTGKYGAWGVVEGTRLVCDTSLVEFAAPLGASSTERINFDA
jgi:hypothetical protein